MGPDRDTDERNRSDDLQHVRVRESLWIVFAKADQEDIRSSDFYDIMDMINKRLNDKGRNWRHVLKALKVLDYCLHEGSELVVTWARKSIYIIKTLREFQYVDDEGRDVGQNGTMHLCLWSRKL
jgi:epsin